MTLEKSLELRAKKLEEQNLELIKTNATNHYLLSSISREIRNPLNGILGIVQLLKENSKSQPDDIERIQHLESCAKDLHDLVGQILDYSTLGEGTLKPRGESFNANLIIDSAIDACKTTASKKQLNLVTDFPPLSANWEGDPLLFKQIIVHSLSNTIDHTDAGSIHLSLTTKTAQGRCDAIVTVENTASDTELEKEKYILTDFTQLRPNDGSNAPGSTLGLLVAAQLAILIDGNLELFTGSNNSRRLSLTIPLREGSPIDAPEEIGSNTRQLLKGKRALVADDMNFNRYINKELLGKMGALVDEASDGEEALDALYSTHYDLVVLDLNMPKKSGSEVIAEYLANVPKPKTTFIALSADLATDSETRCLESGFNHFIEKPLDHSKLTRILADATDSGASASKSHLLNYIANNNPQAAKDLENRYRKAFAKELARLRNAYTQDDSTTAGPSLHKLTGLSNLRRETCVAQWLESLSEKDPPRTTSEKLEICDKITAHMQQS
ncbi:MAG: response regulator [Opitutaceae bacterium]